MHVPSPSPTRASSAEPFCDPDACVVKYKESAHPRHIEAKREAIETILWKQKGTGCTQNSQVLGNPEVQMGPCCHTCVVWLGSRLLPRSLEPCSSPLLLSLWLWVLAFLSAISFLFLKKYPALQLRSSLIRFPARESWRPRRPFNASRRGFSLLNSL